MLFRPQPPCWLDFLFSCLLSGHGYGGKTGWKVVVATPGLAEFHMPRKVRDGSDRADCLLPRLDYRHYLPIIFKEHPYGSLAVQDQGIHPCAAPGVKAECWGNAHAEQQRPVSVCGAAAVSFAMLSSDLQVSYFCVDPRLPPLRPLSRRAMSYGGRTRGRTAKAQSADQRVACLKPVCAAVGQRW